MFSENALIVNLAVTLAVSLMCRLCSIAQQRVAGG
jgi:hypothetical protein